MNIPQRLSESLSRENGQTQFVRFCINGCVCAGLHYGIYALLQIWIDLNVAFSVGYVLSFIFNFFSTSRFTFHARPTWGRFVGFAGSHVINYLVNIGAFNVLLSLGIHRLVSPLLAMLVAMIINFLLLKFIFTNR